MKKVRVSVDLTAPRKKVRGRVNQKLIDATTELDIARHKKMDDAMAMRDAGKYAARVRKKWAYPNSSFPEKSEFR
jgi:putative transcriptional regulator